MKSWNALVQGIADIGQMKRLLFLLLLVNISIAAIPTMIVEDELARSIGKSAVAEEMSEGYSDLWFQEFAADAQELAKTFHPTVSGIGAIFNGFDAIFTGELPRFQKPILALGILYLLFWIFAAGGIIPLFLQESPFSFRQFGANASRYFGRFLRIFLLAAVFYYILFAWAFPFLEEVVRLATREVIDERVAFALNLVRFVIVILLLSFVSLLSDYTKICTVAERRYSVLLALLRATRLIYRHFWSVLFLYGLVGAMSIFILFIYGLTAPGAGQQSWAGILWALLLGQAYILSRIWIRILFYASQSELFVGFDEVLNWHKTQESPFKTPDPVQLR